MASLGKAFIEIHADLKEFPAETKVKVKEALEGAAKDMDLKPIENKVGEAGERGADKLEKSMSQRLREKAGQFGKRGEEIGDKIMSGMSGMIFSRGALIAGLIATAVLGGAQLIAPIAALAAAIPAAMSIAIASVAGLAVAFKGVGTAISAAFGDDQEALNKAMAKLAPAARGVVAEFASFRPQLHALQQDIQQTFFVQLEGSVKRLMTNLLPGLRAGMHVVSADLGKMFRGMTDVLGSAGAKNDLNAIFAGIHKALQPLMPMLGDLVRSFLKLSAAAMPFVGALSMGLGEMIGQFARFIDQAAASGALKDFFQGALDVMRLLHAPLSAVFSILKSLMDAVSSGGPDILAILGQVANEIAKLFASPQGQELMVAIGTIVVALGQILIAIAPVLPPLAQLIAHVGMDLANALIASLPLIESLADKLAALITWVDNNKDSVEDLAVVLGTLYAAFKIAKAVDDTVTSLKKMADAVKALSIVQSIATWMRGLTTATAAATVATDVMTASVVAQNVAWYANPIGLIILAIAAIIAGIVLLVMHWDDVKKAGTIAWNAIKNAASAVWDWIKGAASAVGDWFGKIGDWFASLPDKLGEWLASLPSKLYNLLISALEFAGTAIAWGIGLWLWTIIKLPGLIWDGLKWLGKTLWDLLTAAWNWATDAVSKGVDAVVDFAVKLPGRVGKFLSELPGVLAHAFKTAWQWAKDETAKAGDWIINFAKGLPGRLGKFFGNVGHDIVSGLKSGINAAIRGFNHGVDQVGEKLHIGLPHIPLLAKGAIIDNPTLAVVGERGPEVVIPLTDPARAQQLAAQSGLLGVLKQGGAAPVVNVAAYLGTGQILEVIKTVVNTVVNGQAVELANGVRTA